LHFSDIESTDLGV